MNTGTFVHSKISCFHEYAASPCGTTNIYPLKTYSGSTMLDSRWQT